MEVLEKTVNSSKSLVLQQNLDVVNLRGVAKGSYKDQEENSKMENRLGSGRIFVVKIKRKTMNVSCKFKNSSRLEVYGMNKTEPN